MKDLQSTLAMWLKGVLFLLIGLMSGGILLIEHGSWRMALLLGLCIWGFCRAYYFAFYVIQHWVDPGYKFSGLGHFLTYMWKQRQDDEGSKPKN
ncbi:hypothetical protein [Prosthecobacter dejongeii]|uniref:CHASE2 domain-containing sensor protein n=1 Tax=Prosthecobacter dejongeii TaxID=48465 RepID=A0A7W7YLV3_9BACT|nr:hypothetical protein [Prosthecobacter dejongeii]MBB5038367.1 CHASE2 domain-containing sensor protein [Prosthecobacter dejongeii]